MGLVKIKDDSEFRWGPEQQKAFDEIKEYLSMPPILVPPQQRKSFYVYLSVGESACVFFDESACDMGCRIGILLVSPRGAIYSFSIKIPNSYTNNMAEYKVVRKGMEILLEAGAEVVEVFGDSKLIIS